MLAANRWGVCGMPRAIDKHVKIGSLSCLVLEDRAAGSQASKIFYADAQQMHAKHADGPESGVVLHG